MAKTATMTIRIDPEIKSGVETLYASYGMSISEAINVFLYKSLSVKGLPFDLRPSHETLEALREVEEMKKHPEKSKGYTDVEQMFNEILTESD